MHGGYGAEIDPYAGYYQGPHQLHAPIMYQYPPFDMAVPGPGPDQSLTHAPGPFFEHVSRAPGAREER
jgi:hypothetical protein